MKKFDELVEIIKKLREPNGCPWDREQTLESLKPHLLEETYEVLEAMDEGGEKLKGELGDLLLQVVFQSNICEEKGEFKIDDVISSISEKMIRRHPHVFGEEKNIRTSDEVL
ncbi:MAG: MazG nucleotide pyrophosphohydrolase domain-containing protein, partial [Cetobacterium sp.]